MRFIYIIVEPSRSTGGRSSEKGRETERKQGGVSHNQPESNHHGSVVRTVRSGVPRMVRRRFGDRFSRLRCVADDRQEMDLVRRPRRCRLDREHEHGFG